MIQAVLTQLVVYWGHLYYLPEHSVHNINQILANFLWSGPGMHSKIPLVKFQSLCIPKKHGGWGISNIRAFNSALLIKSLWRAIRSNGIWHDIISVKYLHGKNLQEIFWGHFKLPRGISAIWLGFKKILSIFSGRLIWQFGNGLKIVLGADRIYGMCEDSFPSPRIIHWLSHKGIFHFYQIIHYWDHGAPILKSASILGLTGRDAEDWKIYSQNVQVGGLCHGEIGDVITWAGSLSLDAVVVSETYSHIISLSASETIFSEFWSFWGRSIPTKILVFGWLVWKGKILTWVSFKRRGFQGPGRCVLCCLAEETVSHLFFTCPVVLGVWKLFSLHFIDPTWIPQNFLEAALCWDKFPGMFQSLLFFSDMGSLVG